MRYAVAVLLGAALMLAYTWSWADRRVAEALASADSAQAWAVHHERRADSLAAQRNAAARADSVQMAALTDSVAIWRARAVETGRRRAEARRRVQDAVARATEASERVVAVLDSVGRAAFEEYAAERNAEVRAERERANLLVSELRDARAETVALWDARRSAEDLYAAAMAENDALRARAAALESSNAALRRGLETSKRRDHIVGMVAVVLAAKLAYDVITG